MWNFLSIILCSGAVSLVLEDNAVSFLEGLLLVIFFSVFTFFYWTSGSVLTGPLPDGSSRPDEPARVRYWDNRARGASHKQASDSVNSDEQLGCFIELLKLAYLLLAVFGPPFMVLSGAAAMAEIPWGLNREAQILKDCEYKVIGDVVNIRSGPSTDSPRKGQVGIGSNIKLISKNGE